MSLHVERAQWPVLLSSTDDPERIVAEGHARQCAECDRERVIALAFLSELAALPPLPGPSSAALARAKRQVVGELKHPWRVWQPARWKALLGVLAFGLLVTTAHQRSTDRSSLIVAAVLLAVAVAFLAGNRWPGIFWSLPVLLVIPVGVLAATPTFEIDHGLACALSELFAAALPVGALWLVARRGADVLPSDFARAAIGGALAGQAALAITCPSHALGHLLVFHGAVVIVAALMGAAVGQLRFNLSRNSY